jgi:hypothetical protein
MIRHDGDEPPSPTSAPIEPSPPARGPIDGFVLRLASPHASWVVGVYESEADATEQARRGARSDPHVTDAFLWEYRHGCVVGYQSFPLSPA